MKRSTKFNTPIDLMLPEWIVDAVLEVYDGEDAERELLRLLSTNQHPCRFMTKQEQHELDESIRETSNHVWS
jgi:hypothetical protein